MLSGKFIVSISLLLSPGTHFPLPTTAVVTIGPTQRDIKDPTSESCKDYHLTERQVRKLFKTYHSLTEREYHDYYLYLPCWIEGTVTVDGKTYTWRSQPGNTLETTWPDGTLKTLGGKHTDNPAGD